MNKDQDYPSDSDDSDKDFCPDNESNSDIPSEEESDYKSSGSEDEKKKISRKSTKKKMTLSKIGVTEIFHSGNENKKNDSISEEEEKKRSDELWASFLSDVNEITENNSNIPAEIKSEIKNEPKDIEKNGIKIDAGRDAIENQNEGNKVKVTEILEFAGEEIEITKEIADEIKIEKPLNTIKHNNLTRKVPLKRPSGGLSSVLNQIGKKTKISVLEKSKLDWDGFKNKEGLKEELQTFNKGKDGYLEKQDFLQRTDVRQFEIEKNLRQATRKF